MVFFSQKKGLGTILSDLYVKSLMAALWNSEISPFYAPVGLSKSAAPNGKVQSFLMPRYSCFWPLLLTNTLAFGTQLGILLSSIPKRHTSRLMKIIIFSSNCPDNNVISINNWSTSAVWSVGIWTGNDPYAASIRPWTPTNWWVMWPPSEIGVRKPLYAVTTVRFEWLQAEMQIWIHPQRTTQTPKEILTICLIIRCLFAQHSSSRCFSSAINDNPVKWLWCKHCLNWSNSGATPFKSPQATVSHHDPNRNG